MMAALVGKVTAKAEKAFDLEAMKPGGPAQQTKVTVAEDTKFVKFEAGALGDVTEGYFVSVFGPADGGKVTAAGIMRGMKPEAGARPGGMRGTMPILRAAGRMLGAQDGQRPTAGLVTSVNPLKIRTRDGEVEVITSETTKVARLADVTFADVQTDARVLVVPKEEPKENACVARTVALVPQMGERRRKDGEEKK